MVYLWLMGSLPTQSSSQLPRRDSTLSATFVLVISTNEDHRHQRMEDGRMKEVREKGVKTETDINASDEK